MYNIPVVKKYIMDNTSTGPALDGQKPDENQSDEKKSGVHKVQDGPKRTLSGLIQAQSDTTDAIYEGIQKPGSTALRRTDTMEGDEVARRDDELSNAVSDKAALGIRLGVLEELGAEVARWNTESSVSGDLKEMTEPPTETTSVPTSLDPLHQGFQGISDQPATEEDNEDTAEAKQRTIPCPAPVVPIDSSFAGECEKTDVNPSDYDFPPDKDDENVFLEISPDSIR